MTTNERARPAAAAERFAGRRALVTGGTGFLGGHLANALAREGARVTALGRSARPPRLALDPRVRLLRVDLADRDASARAVAALAPEDVFHLAAAEATAPLDACLAINLGATVNLLHAVAAAPLRALVLASSAAVYGDGPLPFREEQPPRPASPYAISKLAAEHVCLWFHRARGYPVRVVRLSTVFGPGQAPERLVPSVIHACLRGERLPMGAPDQRRDFVYVADAVEGLLRAALSPAAAGEVVNLGCERAVAVREVVELVRARLAPCPEPLWEGRPRRPGEARRWAASEAKARRLLDWAPPSDGLASGLERTIHWCRSTLDRSLDRSKETPWIPS